MTEQLAMLVAASADSASAPTSLITSLVQFGFLGLLVIDLVGTHKFIVPRWTLDALSAERDRREVVMQVSIDRQAAEITDLRDVNTQLQATISDRMMPALTLATDAQRAYVEALGRRANP